MTRITLTAFDTGSIQSSTLLYPSPITMPATVSRAVQIKLPAVVQSKKGVMGIISMPAGTEIKVEPIGFVVAAATIDGHGEIGHHAAGFEVPHFGVAASTADEGDGIYAH